MIRKILFVLLITIFSNVYGSCFDAKPDFNDCKVKAEQGDAKAQYNLGQVYRKGLGVAQDYGEAEKWYRKAAEQGVGEAQFNLGLLLSHHLSSSEGPIVLEDHKKAARWMKKTTRFLEGMISTAAHRVEKARIGALDTVELYKGLLKEEMIDPLAAELKVIEVRVQDVTNTERRKWAKVRAMQLGQLGCKEYTNEKDPRKWQHKNVCYSEKIQGKYTEEGWVWSH